jgi:hypothetical protein
MIPYFYKLQSTLISEELGDKVVKLALDNLDKFVSYKGQKTGIEDNNNYYFGPLLSQEPEIQRLVGSCTLECFPIIMLHRPNIKVIRHVDNPNRRNTVLSIPLFPKGSYSPTWFWKPKESFEKWSLFEKLEEIELELVATVDFTDNMPVLLNTQKVHSLDNLTESFRVQIQLCFGDSFEAVYEKLRTNTLFL